MKTSLQAPKLICKPNQCSIIADSKEIIFRSILIKKANANSHFISVFAAVMLLPDIRNREWHQESISKQTKCATCN